MRSVVNGMIDVDIRVGDERWSRGCDLDKLVDECIAATTVGIDTVPKNAEFSVLFTDDAEQRTLNQQHRGKDSSTNVLSFPVGDTPLPPGMPQPLGDISLAFETVEYEAQTGGITFDAHLRHLIIHGFLHLLGYDHDTDAEALVMESTETRALARLGIADPYRPDQV